MKYLIVIALSLFGVSAAASDLPKPEGRIILTVSGNISHTNGDGVAEFDRAMLEELAQQTMIVTTPWMEGPREFSGPLGSAILEAVGAQGESLAIVALNDYSAPVPARDLRDYDVVFATAIDGNTLSVRDKGPLFMVYPFDEHPELFNEVYFSRSVWQIAQIIVQD